MTFIREEDLGDGLVAGASGSEPGSLKFDGDKPMMNLVPLSSVYAVAQVMTFGAKKYSPNGWKSVPDAVNRYTAAMLRHMTAIQEGEEVDEDSGLPHADHVACNALFLSWFRRNEEKTLEELVRNLKGDTE
jgi:hypothetical protein